MDILKIIFKNSIIYKMFLFILVTYENSYLKIICDKFVISYKNSYINKMVQRYLNSTPSYKYSFVRKINEKIYCFVVDYSKFIYNFVKKNFENSYFVSLFSKSYNEVKQDKFQSTTLFLTMFLWFFTIGRFFVTGGKGFIIVYAIGTIFFLLCFAFSKQIKKLFFNSFLYKCSKRLLELEVSNE